MENFGSRRSGFQLDKGVNLFQYTEFVGETWYRQAVENTLRSSRGGELHKLAIATVNGGATREIRRVGETWLVARL